MKLREIQSHLRTRYQNGLSDHGNGSEDVCVFSSSGKVYQSNQQYRRAEKRRTKRIGSKLRRRAAERDLELAIRPDEE